MHAAGARDQALRKLEGVGLAGAAAEHERDQLVVAKGLDAQMFQLLAGPIVWFQVFHQRYT